MWGLCELRMRLSPILSKYICSKETDTLNSDVEGTILGLGIGALVEVTLRLVSA